MKICFKNLALLSALICLVLALIWLLAPEFLLSFWSVGFSGSVGLVCRRNAALFAGMGVMLFGLRHAAPLPARSAIAMGFIVARSMLALLGMIEFTIGHAGSGILLAVAVQIVLALGFRLAN